MDHELPDIVFVYKADSGLLNKLKDAVHKTFSPATYACKLCDVTYSPISMRAQWKRFVKQLPLTVEFTYMDIIKAKYPDVNYDYPCAFLRHSSTLTPWLTAEQINACDTIDELIALVKLSMPDSVKTVSDDISTKKIAGDRVPVTKA